jgi:hypothetical protein
MSRRPLVIIRVDQDERGDFHALATLVAPIHPLSGPDPFEFTAPAEVGPHSTLGGLLDRVHREILELPHYSASLAPRTRHGHRQDR